MNKLQPGRIQTAAFFFSATSSSCVVALELARVVAPNVPTISHVKRCYCFLLPITSQGRFSIPCCHLSRPPVSRLGKLPSVKNQRTSKFTFAESKCADTGTNDTGILQRSVRGLEPVCFATSHKAFFHMKPRAVSHGDCSHRK